MLTVEARSTQTFAFSGTASKTVTAGSFRMTVWVPVAPQKKARLSHDEMLALARKNPPAQSWFEEDFSTLGRPKR
jgi:hypothetical protein